MAAALETDTTCAAALSKLADHTPLAAQTVVYGLDGKMVLVRSCSLVVCSLYVGLGCARGRLR